MKLTTGYYERDSRVVRLYRWQRLCIINYAIAEGTQASNSLHIRHSNYEETAV
jgi:hypothetical protein